MSKMITCKSCNAEIASSAKSCPKCGAKNKKPVYKRVWFWVVIVIVAIIFIGGGEDEPTLSKDSQNQTESSGQGETGAPKFFKVGETVETSKVKATITEMKKSKGSEYNTPEDGNEFVLLKVTIENISDNQELNISSVLSFSAYVDDTTINESLTALMEGDNTMDGTIAPGKKMTGTLGYEVPKDWKEIEVHFEPELWDTIKIQWIVENK